MSRSRRLYRAALGGWLILIGLLGPVWGQQQTPQPAPQAQQQQSAKPEPSAPPLAPSAPLNGVIESVSCATCASQAESRKEQREEDDLVAQQDMATWAFIVVLIGGLQLIANTVTLVFLWRTFQETRRTANGAIEAADAAKAQARIAESALRDLDRAYLFAGPDNLKSGMITEFKVMIFNYGKTPAFFKEILVELADNLPGPEPIYGTNKQEFWRGEIDSVIGGNSPYLGSGNNYRYMGERARYCFGYVKYEDIFKKPHISRFCCLIDAPHRKVQVVGGKAWNDWD